MLQAPAICIGMFVPNFRCGAFSISLLLFLVGPWISACSSEEPVVITEAAYVGPPLTDGVHDAESGKPAVVNGRLSVCGSQLCNDSGFPVQLRGMSTHGLQWYGWGDCITEGSLDALSEDWGADIIRLSLYVERNVDGYQSDPKGFTQAVDLMIEEVSLRGMYVMIDWHQLGDGDPRTNLEDAKVYFTHMSETHGHRPNVLYEIANEPTGVTWEEIKEYAREVIPVIRKNDPESVIIVGTPQWSSLGLSGGDDTPMSIAKSQLEFDNIMYTYHFYAASHAGNLPSLREVADELPIFVTEWGTQDYSGDGENDLESSQKFLDFFEEKKISWINWNFSDDMRSGAVLKEGTCRSKGPWSGDSLKESGEWIQSRMLSPVDNFRVKESAGGGGGAGGEKGAE